MVELQVRKLVHGERRPVLEVFAGMSERSRELRFHGAKPRLPEAELAQLVDVGCCGREAVAAVESASGRAIGIARFVRDHADDAVAEVAFAVADDWQGRGVGKRLVAELVPVARAAGVSRFRASVVAGNDAAVALLRRAGRVVAAEYVDGTLELEIDLSAAPLTRAA
jgi:GNAT superfamily N-acetyltransferase